MAAHLRQPARRGRRALLIALATFVLANAGLSVALSHAPDAWREPHSGPRLALLARRANVTPRPDTVVFLGSSRTLYGVRAGEMEQRLAPGSVAFNLARQGGGIASQLHVWRRLHRLGVRVDVAVVEVSSFLFAEGIPYDDLAESRVPAVSLDAADVSLVERYSPGRAGIRGDWLLGHALPWLSWRRQLLDTVAPRLLPPSMRDTPVLLTNESGDAPIWHPDPDVSRAERTGSLSARHCEFLRGRMPGALPAEALEELLDDCQARGARVVLVMPPEGRLFRADAPADKVAAFERYVAGRQGVTVLDARDWLADADIEDGFHLTGRGASIYTERLGREAVSPSLRGPALAGRRR